jgi:hypothetical protein
MALRRIAGFFFSGLRQPMPCESCGEQFICGAGLKGCWCMEIKLDAAARAKMRQQFRDCLCRNCLQSRADEAADEPAGSIDVT